MARIFARNELHRERLEDNEERYWFPIATAVFKRNDVEASM